MFNGYTQLNTSTGSSGRRIFSRSLYCSLRQARGRHSQRHRKPNRGESTIGLVRTIRLVLTVSIQGLYPTMIVVLVNLNRSVWNSTEVSHQVNHSTMCFASTPGHTATTATNNGQRHASIHFETVLHTASISDPDCEHRDDKPESVDMA